MRSILPASLVVLASISAGCRPETTPDAQRSAAVAQVAPAASPKAQPDAYAGSQSCRDCHEDFYKLWATSWHGLAMQPYSAEFAERQLTAPQTDVTIGNRGYRAEIGLRQGWVREQGPNGERRYPIVHVMGGKNVYYFLTPLEQGRLQVLPVAYDVHRHAWYDTAASGVRHFPDRRDEPLDWTDRLYTFNTACFNCHVSQWAANYDLETDTYRTTWGEPGISCESCHGPAGEHLRAMKPGLKGLSSQEIKLIRAKEFTHQQTNDLCATCHAKMVPLGVDFVAGEKFFDHYDLVTLEHPDFYPDGRDLGENYTYTSWLMSPCLKSGKLDCNHCHTPSGRMRFAADQVNQSCLPCHEHYVRNPAGHGNHQSGSKGNECVACHMPMTRFAAMGRSDHSMRPPTPAATIAYGSPNACNLCHADHDTAWADDWVRKWYKRDYQAEVLRRAGLIDAARKNRWDRLPEILAELARIENDAVYRNSLVRLLRGSDDPRKWPALIRSLKDPSPLVRASAVSSFAGHVTGESVAGLLAAASDQSRLVRIRAAMALAAIPLEILPGPAERQALEKATEEFKKAMKARPDDWASYANLGNFYMERRDFPEAVRYFETAQRLEPRMIGPIVNAALAYSNMNRNDRAELCLRRALELEPANAAVNFNLGLLLAEHGKLDEAEKTLRTALKSDPQLAAAAYNLGVILAGKKNLAEAVVWCRKAAELRPDEAKYAHSLAFFLHQQGHADGAIQVLRNAIGRNPLFLDGYVLLAEIHEGRGDRKAAVSVLREALAKEGLPPPVQQQLEAKVRVLESAAPGKDR